MWIFGYGSLVWRPSYDYRQMRPGWIEGWERRFWQGSADHRGVPEAPGRVVTLVESAGARCWGMAYEIDRHRVADTLGHLDHREKGGYRRLDVPLFLPGGEEHAELEVEGLCYLAEEGNECYLGSAPDVEIAAQVLESHGPSGSNVEYVLRLSEALRELGADDPHVFAIEALVREELA